MQTCARASLLSGSTAGRRTVTKPSAVALGGLRCYALPRSPAVRARQRKQKQQRLPLAQQQLHDEPQEEQLQDERHRRRRQRQLQAAQSSGKWPMALLNAARAAGGLPVPVDLTVLFLEEFSEVRVRGTATPEYVLKMLEAMDAKPVLLSLLASILLRDHSKPAFKGLAKHLFVLASQLQDEAASLTLVEQALRSATGDMSHPELTWAKRNLHAMVKANNSHNNNNVAAAALLARSYELQNNPRAAIEVAEAATTSAGSNADNNDSNKEVTRAGLVAAWEIIARAKGKLGDARGRRKALEKGALELDDAQAYFLLGMEYRKADPDGKFIRYILKSAASGVRAAAYEAGKWYFRKGEAQFAALPVLPAAPPPSPHDAGAGPAPKDGSWAAQYTFASEWLLVAVESPAGDADARNHNNNNNNNAFFFDRGAASLLILASLARKHDWQSCHAYLRDFPGDPLVARLQRWLERYAKDAETRNKGLGVFLAREVDVLLKREE